MDFATAVRTVRQQRGWTQAQLASAAQLSRRHVIRIEAGEPYGGGTYNRIISALGHDFGRDLLAEAERIALAE